MDLKAFYSKMRQVEAGLPGDDVVIVSLSTPDGGKPGVTSEVPRTVAARMIVSGSARAATAEEADAHQARISAAKREAEQRAAAGRMQITVISDSDLQALKSSGKKN